MSSDSINFHNLRSEYVQRGENWNKFDADRDNPAVFEIVQLALRVHHIYERPNKFDTSMDVHRFIRASNPCWGVSLLRSRIEKLWCRFFLAQFQTLYLMKIVNTKGNFYSDLLQTKHFAIASCARNATYRNCFSAIGSFKYHISRCVAEKRTLWRKSSRIHSPFWCCCLLRIILDWSGCATVIENFSKIKQSIWLWSLNSETIEIIGRNTVWFSLQCFRENVAIFHAAHEIRLLFHVDSLHRCLSSNVISY